MGENSSISWTDHTFNPWRGCTKIAPGCANCYAAREAKRFPDNRGIWGDSGTRVRAADSMWEQPKKWDREAAEAAVRKRVFCASLADVFEDWRGPIRHHRGFDLWTRDDGTYTTSDHYRDTRETKMGDLRRDLFALIDATPNLDWLLLTKRPENIVRMWRPKITGGVGAADGMTVSGIPFRENVWLGASVSEQETADRNIPELLRCRQLAPVLFASYEPALGPVDFTRLHFDGLTEVDSMNGTHGVYRPHGGKCGRLDWVIAGGESGPQARPCHPAWMRSALMQCGNAGVPFHFKQWGEWMPVGTTDRRQELPFMDYDVETKFGFVRAGKKAAGRLLDGFEHNGFPRLADARSAAQ